MRAKENTFKLDHVVVKVDDLDLASTDLGALGFTVVEGGEHADGLSRNSLIAFADGSYIELITFIDTLAEGHPFASAQLSGEGIFAYALIPDDIETAVAGAKRRGLKMSGPRDGGRMRPDGVELRWRTASSPWKVLPFLCADVTPRGLRVPHGPAVLHSNGAKGITEVRVLTRVVEGSIRNYRGLLGDEHQNREDGAVFRVGDCDLKLERPHDDTEQSYLRERGDGPFSLVLSGTGSASDPPFSLERAHGLRFQFGGRTET